MKTITQLGIFNNKIASLTYLFVIFISLGTFAQNTGDPNGEGDDRMKIIMEFTSTDLNVREIEVIADNNATSNYDLDFDVQLNNALSQDMYWMIGGAKFTQQGIDEISTETVLPLGIKTDMYGMNSIAIDKLENMPSTTKTFLHDKDLDVYFDLADGAYEVNLAAGEYNNRFELVFQAPETLGLTNSQLNDKSIRVFYNNSTSQINVQNKSNVKIEGVEVYAINGQRVYAENTINSRDSIKVNTYNMGTGAYIVLAKTETHVETQKIIIH
ncbi:T9SS type A sorting domain-containing protein [Psychroserpens sp. XS_ASV72]|uniref:T9SS type A sorting domain-containing protein n=1 Tax=Psychroserpens sp. XS_ASV72 TaxID=3241293 RepID=UPI003513421F